jgi:hypothetical protein
MLNKTPAAAMTSPIASSLFHGRIEHRFVSGRLRRTRKMVSSAWPSISSPTQGRSSFTGLRVRRDTRPCPAVRREPGVKLRKSTLAGENNRAFKLFGEAVNLATGLADISMLSARLIDGGDDPPRDLAPPDWRGFCSVHPFLKQASQKRTTPPQPNILAGRRWFTYWALKSPA